MEKRQIGSASRTTLSNFSTASPIASGIYIAMTTSAAYDIFVALSYDGNKLKISENKFLHFSKRISSLLY